MAKGKRELLSEAPWRGDDNDAPDKFKDAKLKVTRQSGSTSTMHVPGKKNSNRRSDDDEDDLLVLDPELRYSFQRNFQVQFNCIITV